MGKFVSLAFAPLSLLASAGGGDADEQGDRQAFREFLVQAKNNVSADNDKVAAFYRTTGAFWRAHWLDYSLHPEKYADVMPLYRANQAIYLRPQAPDPERYRKDIEPFKEFDSKNALPNNPALFVGSSTIMKWKTAEAFPGFSVINRGFGGSFLEDVLYFYHDVIGKYHPSAILFYCDNDVAAAMPMRPSIWSCSLSRVRVGLPQRAVCFLEHEACAQLRVRGFGEPNAIDRFNDLAKALRRRTPDSNISTSMRRCSMQTAKCSPTCSRTASITTTRAMP